MASRRTINDSDISKLRELLAGTQAHVRAPGDDGYEESIYRWSKAAEKRAGVAIVPTSAEDVSIAIKYASSQGLDVSVKGGGHSTAGVSSTNGGLLLDLGRMRNVKVDQEKQLLHVQGGCLWMDVDAEAWKYGLATVGGTVADTGVGGLSLGGGYGHLSGGHGLVIDNTVEFTIVLASGEIEKVTKEGNEELFWALNGAGQNFGVVTDFVLKCWPQKELYLGTLLFEPTTDNIKQLVAACNEIWDVKEGPNGPETKCQGKAGALLGYAKPPPAEGATMLLMNLVFNGSEAESKELLKPLFDIGPAVNQMRMDAYPEVNKLVPAMYGLRSSMKGAACILPLREEFLGDVKKVFEDYIDDCEDAAATVIAWELFDPCKVASLDEGSFANRGYHLNGLVMPMWTKEENDQKCRQFARDVSDMFKKEIQEHGKTPSKDSSVRGSKGAVMLYGNYDQYEEISRDIFGDNYPRLQQLKAKYDPDNMFNKLFAIKPDAKAQL